MILTNHDTTAGLELTADASGAAAGAVLHHVVEGMRSPLAVFSRKFNPLEAKKSAFDRELLDIVQALKHFNLLLGTRLTIHTHHKPILNALDMKNPTPQ